MTHGRNANVWSTIPKPSHWEFHGFGTYTTGWTILPQERGLYRHSFAVPKEWAGRRTHLVFEGSMTDTTVLMNGRSAGPTHQGGFNRVRYDVTDLLAYGATNRLEVTMLRDSTDESVNRAERQGDYWNFGGIYRPVHLQSLPADRRWHARDDRSAYGTAGWRARGRGSGVADERSGATNLGPESQPNVAIGEYRRTLYFRFGG